MEADTKLQSFDKFERYADRLHPFGGGPCLFTDAHLACVLGLVKEIIYSVTALK